MEGAWGSHLFKRQDRPAPSPPPHQAYTGHAEKETRRTGHEGMFSLMIYTRVPFELMFPVMYSLPVGLRAGVSGMLGGFA